MVQQSGEVGKSRVAQSRDREHDGGKNFGQLPARASHPTQP